MGLATIEARVKEFLAPVPLSPDESLRGIERNAPVPWAEAVRTVRPEEGALRRLLRAARSWLERAVPRR